MLRIHYPPFQGALNKRVPAMETQTNRHPHLYGIGTFLLLFLSRQLLEVRLGVG